MSAEVEQSTIDFLDGTVKHTSCCRRVFFELITATWCGKCPGADGAFDRILRDSNYFPGKATLVEIHPSASGDFYNADAKARSEWYSYAGQHPTAIFDGLTAITAGGGSNPNMTSVDTMYRNVMDNRQPTLPRIDMATFGQKTGNSGWINLSIELLNPTPIKNLKVHFWVVEDVYPYKTGNGAYLRHTLRDALTPEDFIPPNHKPTIKDSLPNVNMMEDTSDTGTIWLRPAFDDKDLDPLTYHSNQDGENKKNFTIEIDDEGNVTLTPDPDWNGVDQIDFYVNDGNIDSDPITVQVTVNNVNDGPVLAYPMNDFTMNEDVPVLKKYNLSHVFSDVDLDPVLNGVPQAPLEFSYSGNSNIDVTITDGWVNFDPIPNWNGNETIIFTAKDSSGLKATDDVSIWVRSGNDKPILKVQFPDTDMNEDETKKDFMDLYEFFNDPDGDSLTFDVEHSDNIDVRLKNSLVTVTPNANYWGTEILTFSATDIPGTTPVTGNMTLIINSVNDIPILNETEDWIIRSGKVQVGGITVKFDQGDNIDITITAYDPADNDVLIFSEDSLVIDIDSDTGVLSFTPTNADVGTHDVVISIDDQQELNNKVEKTFKFIIENVNDPPDTPQILSPTDGNTYLSSLGIRFSGDCHDPDLDLPNSDESLMYEWTDQDGETLSFDKEFTSRLEPGEYTITLTVKDRKNAKSSAEIEIIVEIDKTIDTDKDGTPDYLDEDDDGDGMPDKWEEKFAELDPLDYTDADEDPDNDKYTNLQEYLGRDGKPGGDDSTNPTSRASNPGTGDSGSGGDDKGSSNTIAIAAGIAVVIVVLLLLFLFMFMKKRKKGGEKSEDDPKPQTQTQDKSEQPQVQTSPAMQIPMQNQPIYPPMQPQQSQQPTAQPQQNIIQTMQQPQQQQIHKTCPACAKPVMDGWAVCPNCKGFLQA
jgi:hypothetical protein